MAVSRGRNNNLSQAFRYAGYNTVYLQAKARVTE